MSAKEMFEELGWRQYFISEEMIGYEKRSRSRKSNRTIRFFVKNKTFCISEQSTFAQSYGLNELQAINKQVEELGWND